MLENIFFSLGWIFLILIMVACCISVVVMLVIAILYLVKMWRAEDGKV